MPPGLSGSEINDDDAVTPFHGAVGDVRYALTTGSYVLPQVEADIVQVGVWEGDLG